MFFHTFYHDSFRLSRYICKFSLLISFAIFTGFPFALPSHAQLMRNSAKECAICHFRWLDQFFVEGRGTDLVEYQKERVAGSEMICYSCHNGIMLDSRERFWAKRGHACNMIPSKNVRIPPEMPLGEKGEVVCATCHTVHGVSDELRYQETIYLRCSNRNSEMCMMCHVTKLGGKAHGNHPVHVTGIPVPQRIFDQYGRVGAKGEIICETCHTVHGTIDKNLLVIPDRIGENVFTSELCEACHGSNPSRPDKGVGMGTHPVNITPKDARPPEIWEGGRNVAFGEKGQIICETCHWPHNAQPSTCILAKKGETKICMDCHKRQTIIAGTDHDLSVSAPQTVNIYEQNAEGGGICSPCHIPHNAGPAKLWARKSKLSPEDAVSPLCLSCHETGRPAEKKPAGLFSHPVGLGLKRIKAKTDLPLYADKGNKSADGSVTCATCHNAHQWDPAMEQSGPGMNKEGDTHNSFLRYADVPASSLCMTCHQDKKTLIKTKHDLSVSAPEEVNLLNQTIKKGGVCSPCHLVHNASSIKIWARQAASQNKTITSLCLSCHSPKKCGEKKLTGLISHPTEKAMSLMGEEYKISYPQFDLSGRRTDNKGQITCASCHDPHQWSPKKKDQGTGKMLEGDGQNSFLRMANDEESSLCISCHRKKGWLLKTEHDMRITAPKETNIQNQTAKQSGPCSSCHVPHQASGIRIFSKNMEVMASQSDMLCLPCHSKDGCAKEKVITAQTHPMPLQPKTSNPRLPFYDLLGARHQEKGQLTCLTCHEPHQWDPDYEGQGKGKKIEGDGKNSFLRMASSPEPSLCKACHQNQGYVSKTDHDLCIIDPNYTKGTCDACHSVHNGETFRLWSRQIDVLSTGQGPVDLLCQSCHLEGRVGGKKTLEHGFSHAVNVSLVQKGMKTSLPLYAAPQYLPMDQRHDKEKGSILTCQTCHEVHRWSDKDKTPGHSANVEGTIADSFLRQTGHGFGNICLDCHEDKKYVIWSEHDMRLVAPDAKNQIGQTAGDGGACSPCHAVHHAPQKNLLWSRPLEGETDFMLGTCVNCHKKDGCAGAKDVFIGLHPSSFVYTGKIMEQQQLKGQVINIYYPLYDKKGNKTPVGFVTCTTCHDPHQWDPVTKTYPDKKNIEGDPTNSFLRNKGPAFSICLDCHSFEALLKYKGYHQPSEWKPKYWRRPR
ncbi:hypothetical protein JXL19_05370 [bacterium]|nr:hypothetical protein [bacterium]